MPCLQRAFNAAFGIADMGSGRRYRVLAQVLPYVQHKAEAFILAHNGGIDQRMLAKLLDVIANSADPRCPASSKRRRL